MKALILAFAVLAACATGAVAQGRGGGGGGEEEKSPHANPPERPKPDEKAYKAALERIPDPKAKYDPWGGVAPAQTPAPAPAAHAKKK